MMTIRPARSGDHARFAALFPELQVDDPTPSAAKWDTEMVPTTLVADLDGRVVGYVWFQVFAGEGLVRHLVVDPTLRGQRVGQRLLEAVAGVMRAEGAQRWSLNVKPSNASAIALYRRMGMEKVYRSQVLRMPWALVDRLPAPPPEATSLALHPEHDPDAERSQRITPGTLATARALPGRVLRAIVLADRVVAAAVFVPAFPGVYPFRADSPALARALLDALRPSALPGATFVQLMVEGQDELAAALRDAGATVHLDVDHLEGPLPDA